MLHLFTAQYKQHAVTAIAENEKHQKEIRKLRQASQRVSDWAEQSERSKIGFDPVGGDELNIIEQINQLFSDLVVMAALEELFDIYPSKKFETHMGAEAGFDIESTDGEVVAECFAVTTAASNGKLKKDSEKLINKASKQKKYIYFYSQNDIDEKLERIYEKFPEINYRRIKNIS